MGPGMTRLRCRKNRLAGVAFAASLGAKTLAEPHKIPAETITAAPFEAWPTVDGYVIPDETYKLYSRGRQADVPASMAMGLR
jgi:para-nitrobenzyl esterase